jgi:uncharacterized flavoprotein (TIGR03862 family)
VNLAIVGGGPSGLMAAETAASKGINVILFEGNPSPGRKFLVAGHGGLNLTHSESLERFSTRYQGTAPEDFWHEILRGFGPEELMAWATDLGIETFRGTSGRIFPKDMKAAPLLRKWLQRLVSQGVRMMTRHRLVSLEARADQRFQLGFQTEQGTVPVTADAVILGLGGASWPKTGSDAGWLPMIRGMGIEVKPFQPANCGWEVQWPASLIHQAEGQPLKNISVTACDRTIHGELLITKYGLEGGALYQLGSVLRTMRKPQLTIDLKPSFSQEELLHKLGNGNDQILSKATKAWRLGKGASALLAHQSSDSLQGNREGLSAFAKAIPIELERPRGIAEAISSAGGVPFSELKSNLMSKTYPGLFFAGEMLDWEAPTGGYLLQGCFTSGRKAGLEASEYLLKIPGKGIG